MRATSAVVLFLAVLCSAGCGHNGGGTTGPTSPAALTPPVVLAPLPEVPMHGYFMYRQHVDLATVAGWTNWALLYTTSEAESREVAAEARSLRIRITWTPFRGETTSKQWDATWESNKALIRPFAEAGVLHSVYVADEPMASGKVGYEELARRIALVHAEGWKAMIVEQLGGVGCPHPPIDFYGLDAYLPTPRHAVRHALAMHPEVTFYCAHSFRAADSSNPVYPATFPSQQGEADIAREARVQLVWWLWPSPPGYVGAGDDPDVQAEHRQIAASLGVAR